MTVDAIMSRDLVTIGPDEALMEIRERFEQGGFHHLLVVDNDELIGVISDRDVLQALSPFLDTLAEEHRDVRTLGQSARKIMRSEPLTVHSDTDIKEAASILLDHSISCLPVVSASGRLEGIVTSKDILYHFVENDAKSGA